VAMQIAAWWHSAYPSDHAITAFSHSGTIDRPELLAEIDRERGRSGGEEADYLALDALRAYVRACPVAFPEPHVCTDDESCPASWHDGGCQPFWQHCGADGRDISTDFYAEDDATEKRLWEGPDGPSQVWTRPRPGAEWELVEGGPAE
ncbi:MAG TPA: hypothetical protein VFM37_17815, partial [Pseudonocardiaceae bacterium]|nr:hypothetical protein [Pseudonocardiaceae bacterium]